MYIMIQVYGKLPKFFKTFYKIEFLLYKRYFDFVKCSEFCKTWCLCKSFLPIHKYKYIGEIYYHIPLRLLHKFRYALTKNRDCSISQTLLVRWWSNSQIIILRFFSTDILGFESIGAIFMPKNQWFLQGCKKSISNTHSVTFFSILNNSKTIGLIEIHHE